MADAYKVGKALRGTGTVVDFAGEWINELGSTAKFSQNGSVLSGTYASAVSSDDAATVGVVSGFVDGDLIAFTVHWNDFQSITSWVGQLDQHAAQIKTLWQMTSQVDEGEEWASINAGSDTFTLKP